MGGQPVLEGDGEFVFVSRPFAGTSAHGSSGVALGRHCLWVLPRGSVQTHFYSPCMWLSLIKTTLQVLQLKFGSYLISVYDLLPALHCRTENIMVATELQ